MKTDDLIRLMASDNAATAPSPEAACGRAAVIAVLLAASVFFLILSPRPDLSVALESPRFLLKFVVTGALFVTMAVATLKLARPTGRLPVGLVMIAPLLICLFAGFEWLILPPGERLPALIGHNAAICLTAIPAIGLLPLAVFIATLRGCAPVRPALSGGIAGLMSGGLAAIFYASHCTDDSPLFVALWYSLAVGLLAVVGAVAGARLARW